ncbi:MULTISPECIES: hypothetical protein [Streptomyces]|nr:hypothetical protein [Streptomyces canarius]
MHTEIQPQVNTCSQSRKASHTLVSHESGRPPAPDDTLVSYFRGPRFHDIAMKFVQAAGGFDAVDPTAEASSALSAISLNGPAG